MAIRVTQVGNEVWVKNPAHIRVTQIGNEVWVTPFAGNLRVTQAGIEVWRSVANAPLSITGHADGVARVFAYPSNAYATAGEADGYATASSGPRPQNSAIMVVMGI
jgi:hypothetical protein